MHPYLAANIPPPHHTHTQGLSGSIAESEGLAAAAGQRSTSQRDRSSSAQWAARGTSEPFTPPRVRSFYLYGKHLKLCTGSGRRC